MVEKSKISGAVLGASLLAFVAFVICILYINSEVLYTAHSRSEFIYGMPFLNIVLSKPFGVMQYVGAWLSQFLCYPLLGSGLLMSIWALTFFAGVKSFRLHGGAIALMLLTIACLLTSLVDLGYWIYIFYARGYWFSHSLSYLIVLLLLWVARSTPRQWHLVWYLVGVCIYPMLGWYSMLFVLCLALSEKMTWRELCGIIALVFTANIWRELLYSNQKLDDVLMAGFPRFETPSDARPYLATPFWILGAVTLLIPLSARWLSKSFVPVACVVVSIAFTVSLMFRDRNYIDEMRMVRNAENDNWEEVLNIASNNRNLTTSMVFLKNIALMNEGTLLDKSFQMGNIYNNINNPESLHVSLLNIAAPVIYYNYGMLDEGFRLTFECAVQAGFSPFYLKNLARCAYANGEGELLKKYLKLLHHHPCYRHWQPANITATIKELNLGFEDEITGVENSESYVVNTISLWYKSEGKVASEQALFYSMIRCEPKCFWPALRNYFKFHQNETFRVHAQEAYIIFFEQAPEAKRMFVPVSEEIYARYQQFWTKLKDLMASDIDKNTIPGIMYKDFGDTYWYYYFFKSRSY